MEQLPKETSLYEFGEQLFQSALRSDAVNVQHIQMADGRAVEVLHYQASPQVNVRLTRPDVDTQEIIEFDQDSEHSAALKMEMSIVCGYRSRIQLANGEWYANNRFYIGIFDNGAFLMTPSVGMHADGSTFADGWHQNPLDHNSEWWLQDLIKPQQQNTAAE